MSEITKGAARNILTVIFNFGEIAIGELQFVTIIDVDVKFFLHYDPYNPARRECLLALSRFTLHLLRALLYATRQTRTIKESRIGNLTGKGGEPGEKERERKRDRHCRRPANSPRKIMTSARRR